MRTPITEVVPCPYCGSKEARGFWELGPDSPFGVLQCQECKLVYTSPRPAVHTLGHYYPNDYAPYRVKPSRQRKRTWLDRIAGRAIERRCLPPFGNRRLLDVGCGNGKFLSIAAEQGWHVVGLDLSAEAVRIVRDKHHLPAYQGTLPFPQFPSRYFSAITFWASLEHLPDPLEALVEAQRLLTIDGKIYIIVPNLRSLGAKLFRENWFGADIPRHLTHFDSHSLQAMMEKAGFQVEKMQGIRHTDWLKKSASLARSQGRKMGVKSLFAHSLVARPLTLVANWCGWAECLLAVGSQATSQTLPTIEPQGVPCVETFDPLSLPLPWPSALPASPAKAA